MARTSDQDDAGPPVISLTVLREAENACRRCPLYKNATQAVPGEGPRRAALMLVGEQPGNKEDLAGQQFVGPAGRLLDRALEEAEIPRSETFVTNAVKHFKHEMRGKRRLHKRPNAYEIDRCRWWLTQERAIVRPQAIVALGATAARSLFGRRVRDRQVARTRVNNERRHGGFRHNPSLDAAAYPRAARQRKRISDVCRRSAAFCGLSAQAQSRGIAASLPRRSRIQPIWSVRR